ncbi:MAG: hypothetical protein GXO75_11985 [Calditrichaeota bacterium]|nr:hypothetical protein [Calditrichota bacterium]
MQAFKFNYQDVFRAPRFAFSLQRMWIQLVGLSIGYIVYLILTYLSFLSAGFGLGGSWARYGLLPCLLAAGESYPWYSWLIWAAGSLLFAAILLVTNTAVSRAIYMQVKGNNFYSWRESFSFALRKIWSVLLTPISLLILVGFMIVGGLIIGLLGKIPFIGELGVSFFTILWFFAALLLFFILIVATISVLLVPAIIATTDEDAFEAIFQSFSITWNQPWRFILYEATTLVLSVFAMGIFAFFVKESIMIMNNIFASSMGADFVNLSNNGQAMLQSWLLMGQNVVEGLFRGLAPLVYFQRDFILIPASELPVTVVISSYFYGLSLLFIAGWVLSYGLATFASGNTVFYIVLRKIKDNENLLERKDKEEEEDEEDEEQKGNEDSEKEPEEIKDQEPESDEGAKKE